MDNDDVGISHTVDGRATSSWPTGIPQDDVFRQSRALTDTYDTVRFPGTSELPISLSFQDGYNVVHRIRINCYYAGELKVFVAVPRHSTQHLLKEYRGLVWQGSDLDERTLVDPRSTVAVCTFSYTCSSALQPVPTCDPSDVVSYLAHTHGVRIRVQTYSVNDDEVTEKLCAYWQDIRASALKTPSACFLSRPGCSSSSLLASGQTTLDVANPICQLERSSSSVLKGQRGNSANVHFALLLTQLCWGSAAVVNSLGLSGCGMNPLLFALIRESTAAPLLFVILALARGQLCPWSGFAPASPMVEVDHTTPQSDAQSTKLVPLLSKSMDDIEPAKGVFARMTFRLLPGVFIFIDQFCSLIGVKFAGAVSASAWQPSQVIFTIVISVCMGAEVLTWRKALGAALTFCGALCLVLLATGSTADASISRPLLGHCLLCTTCLASSLEVIAWHKLLRRSRSPLSHFAVMAESYVMAAVLMGVAFAITSRQPFVDMLCPECSGDAWHLPDDALWAVGYAVVVQTIIGYCSQAWALKYAESSLVTLYATLQPVIATVVSCGFIVFGCNPRHALSWPGREMAGTVLIVCGLVVAVPGMCNGCFDGPRDRRHRHCTAW